MDYNHLLQGGQGNLSGEIIKSIKIFFPQPVEQQKIADFLLVLDDKIDAQTKIDIIRKHKRPYATTFPRS